MARGGGRNEREEITLDDKTKIAQLERENLQLQRSVNELSKRTKEMIATTRNLISAYNARSSDAQSFERQAKPDTLDMIYRDACRKVDELNGRLDAIEERRCR
jgi:predicted RNase H-like nuclease (RuvC/YqgF family)